MAEPLHTAPEDRMGHALSPGSSSLSAAPLNWSQLREWHSRDGWQGHLSLRQWGTGEHGEGGWVHQGTVQPLLGKVLEHSG